MRAVGTQMSFPSEFPLNHLQVIKGEDARLLGDMDLMQQIYANLFDLNRDLVLEHVKRTTNHEHLLAALKEVNQMIQKAAKLRVGQPKLAVVRAAARRGRASLLASLVACQKPRTSSN